MCGICGTAGFVDRDLIERMTAALEHRGPDDGGVWADPARGVALGNRRLSILDLSPAGHMPMTSADGRLVLSYNGEVYNFRELRRELEGHGHRFTSGGDTEVVLRGWEQWGVDVLPRLNGMFALAMLDLRGDGEPVLHLARDRFGVKPLYWTRLGTRLLFASEVRAILAHRDVPRESNPEAIHRYLAFLSTPGPETAFRGIFKLPPGHRLRWRAGEITSTAFHEPAYDPDPSLDARSVVHPLRDALRDAVERQLVADVPVGVFLSGGLDSSLVSTLAARAGSERVRAFTIAYRPQDRRLEQVADEDARHARAVARALDAEYQEIVLDPDVTELLPFAVRHLEEPLADPAALSTYLICQAARADVKVLLSGHGADELFAGYRVHRNERLLRMLRRVPDALLDGPAHRLVDAIPALARVVPGVHEGLASAAQRYLRRLLAGAELEGGEAYIFFRRYFAEAEQRALYTDDFAARLGAVDAARRHREHFADAPARDFLNRVLHVDANTFLVDHNLLYSDKMSSAASMELRVPFLDNEVARLAQRMPADLKLRGVTGKYALRLAARGLVPDAVIRRRKAGFGAPVRAWLRNELRPMLDDLLGVEQVRRRGWLRPESVRRLVEEHGTGKADHTYPLWALLSLELWCREFLDAPPAPAR